MTSQCPHCGGELYGVRTAALPAEAVETLHALRAATERGRRQGDLRPSQQLSWYMACLYTNGFTLEAIAAPLGITRQGVQARVKKAVNVGDVPAAPKPALPPPPPVLPPVRTITDEDQQQLRALQKVATQLRGNMGPLHPARRASEDLTETIARLVDQGFSYREIAQPMGITWPAVRARLKSHGYLKNSPSQKNYRGRRVPARAEAG